MPEGIKKELPFNPSIGFRFYCPKSRKDGSIFYLKILGTTPKRAIFILIKVHKVFALALECDLFIFIASDR